MVRAVVTVAVALVLAGCGGFAGAESVETMTPAPVPTDPAPYPPGISDHRIEPSVVANAHASALGTRNYTLTTRERITTPAGEHVYNLSWVQRVSDDGTSYSGDFSQNTSRYRVGQRTSEIEYWTNGTLAAAQYRDEDGELTRYWWDSEGGEPVGDISGSQYLRSLFQTVEMSVVRHGDDDRTILRGTTFTDREAFVKPLSVEDPTDVSVRLVVRPSGIVVLQRIEYDATLESEPVRVVRVTRITAIGSTTVPRPAWLGDSENGDSPSVLEA